jgi:uncharacterized phage-associated protein
VTLKFDFKPEKAIEAVIYIAGKVPNPTRLRVSKILYFADKTSLEQFGRFICGDTYCAMQHGPVPSNTYDLMKEAPASGEWGFRTANNRDVIPLREPDLDELSESDIICLDQALHMYGTVPVWKLIDDSHDEAWKRAWDTRGGKGSSEIPIEDIVRLLEDAEELLEHLRIASAE